MTPPTKFLLGEDAIPTHWVNLLGDLPGEPLPPLFRARRLEQALDTPARIFYKYEGTSPAGSHKPNTAVAQAYENAQAGVRKLATETGAGQWGSALAFACTLFGLECEVFMVGSS